MKPTYYAIVPAAGSGTRMQADIPKQYLKVAGKTLLEHAVNSLTSFPSIERVVVALDARDHRWQNLCFTFPEKILTTMGGKTRAESVLNGLQALQECAKPHDWVLVHDAARPCLLHSDITRLIDTVGDHPVGGILGIPVRDTLKLINAHAEIIKTTPRDNMWCAQTPQLFRFELLREALKEALNVSLDFTDDAAAIENAGKKPLMVLGGAHNLKVTYPEDLALAEKYGETLSCE
jgi:2-C-methyl-D-erythritol 4-phosphate cytidylyltransferase